MAFKMNNPLKMVSALKHNGSPQEGIPTSADTEHNTWHANKDWIDSGGDPNIKKIWNKSTKKWVNSYEPISLKKKDKDR